jgi:ferredoxin-like protein FixX
MDYKVVRVPDYTYRSVPLVKAKAIENYAKLPEEVLNPEVCPLCGGPMEGVEATIRVGYHRCVKCGYGQPVFQVEEVQANFADVGKGILFALGIAALAYLVGWSSRK